MAEAPAPKRFPDRDQIAAVRAEAEPLEAGGEARDDAPVAGRAMARRGMGKLVFLDVVDLSGRIQVICDVAVTGEIDVTSATSSASSGRPAKSRRGEPSVLAESVEVLSRNTQPLPDTFHGLTDVELRYRKRYLDLLMNEETREVFVTRARIVTAIRARARRVGLRRGRDADPPAALRRRVRPAVRHASQRARRGLLPPGRDRALPQAPDRRRARARLRDRQGLPQRGRLVQAQPGVHAARVVRGLRRLPRHDGADRAARRAGRASRCSARPP